MHGPLAPALPCNTRRTYTLGDCNLRENPLPLAARTVQARPTATPGDTFMPYSGIAAVSTSLRSQFLDGLIPDHRKKILAAATPRRFFANSVVTNQGHPADHFFLLTKGLVRAFFVLEEGRKLLFQWLGPGDLFGGRTVGPMFLSLQHRSSNGQFGVGVGSPHNPGSCRAISQVAGEHIVNCARLRGLASRLSHRFSLPHLSTAGCSCTRYSCPDYR